MTQELIGHDEHEPLSLLNTCQLKQLYVGGACIGFVYCLCLCIDCLGLMFVVQCISVSRIIGIVGFINVLI